MVKSFLLKALELFCRAQIWSFRALDSIRVESLGLVGFIIQVCRVSEAWGGGGVQSNHGP